MGWRRENSHMDQLKDILMIIVGHTLNNNPADPANYATFKYCIDSDPTKIYKQYIERTYKDIHTNYDHIESLIKKETNPYKIDLLLINKYFIIFVYDIHTQLSLFLP